MPVSEPDLRQRGPVPTRAAAARVRVPRAVPHPAAAGRTAGGAARDLPRPVPGAGFGPHVARGALPQG